MKTMITSQTAGIYVCTWCDCLLWSL